jgi:hypothetical protein
MPGPTDSINLVEIGALVTAVVALAATIWQAAITRQQNKLSVRPVLTLHRREIDGLIELKNNGFGPAIIQEYEVYKADKIVIQESMHGLLPVEFESPEVFPGVAIAAESSFPLFTAKVNDSANHLAPMESLKFRIVYRSIYGQEWAIE